MAWQQEIRQILIKNGSHIGSTRKVEPMKRFIFKLRQDGLAIINIQDTIDRLRIAARFISRYSPQDVLVASSKEQAFVPIQKFAEYTGVSYIIGRFLPGTLTNPNFEYYTEPELLLVLDPYADRQAISEAVIQRLPVISFASTNNLYRNVDLVIPANNKSRRSIAALFWVLTNFVLWERGDLTEGTFIEEKVEDFLTPVRQG